jgi:hypothetical protein
LDNILLFYFCYLLLIIIFAGRYNIAGYRIVQARTGYFIACGIIIFISVFRFDIGFDYSQYYSLISPVPRIKRIENLEYLSKIIFYIANYFEEPLLIFILFGVINYGFIFYIIYKYSSSRYESLIVFFALFYFTTLSTIRQSIAVSIIFYGYRFIKTKKLFWYIIICLIAFNFHISAIIGLFLYPFYHLKYRYTISFSLLFFGGLYFLLPIFLKNYFQKYLPYLEFQGIMNQSGNYIRIFYVGIFMYCLIIACVYNNFNKNAGLFSIITLGILFPFILGSHTGGRISQYFLIYLILLIPNVNSKLNITKRVVVLSIFYIYFFIYLLTTVYASKSTEYVPYRFYFLTDTEKFSS